MASTSNWSLTAHLLSTYSDEYVKATQHPFLLAAAEGRLPKEVLGRWLANDRLYIHSYIKAAGKLLASIDLPQTVPMPSPKTAESGGETIETQLLDWLIEALAAVRKEERLFIEVAERYGLSMDWDCGPIGTTAQIASRVVSSEAKVPGLVMMEHLFAGIVDITTDSSASLGVAAAVRTPPTLLPWLEGAIIFWGTERCYLDAWSWAKSKQPLAHTLAADDTRYQDADGGALRREFIPNWSSPAFAQFVGRLGGLIDFAVSQELEDSAKAETRKKEILERIEGKWKSLLIAEATFWPEIPA
ncbi:hypothetical protein B0H63DRAFT_463170 [Podospora didyma]|uniref:Thiaminase-2/PQQC domain-containing protein n=1 Tax=Podospora didyma TaxID=330526 RepID=A0AAE0U330_9PEZI|nr:hypothetical protein B0H63DRAFT_463170 [Podospora didyma]